MGIRIHKIMGYGLQDIKTNKSGKISDKRFNKSFIRDMHELDGFFPWLKANEKNATIMLATLLGHDPHEAAFHIALLTRGPFKKEIESNHSNVIHYDSEFGLSNVMVLTPPENKDWQRYDDIIDYIEADTAEPQVTDLFRDKNRCGIYPYESVVLIPGRKNIIKNNKGVISPQDYKMALGKLEGIPPIVNRTIIKSLKEDWAPKIPETILLYSLYANMFADPITVYQLRPMIYTYWS